MNRLILIDHDDDVVVAGGDDSNDDGDAFSVGGGVAFNVVFC